MNMVFSGAKLAVLCGDRLPAILRDDRTDIPYPNLWDLPGGGREGSEGPLACALRETEEELSLRISPARVIWGKPFGDEPGRTWFFAARVEAETLSTIHLGTEGQRWRMMGIEEFLSHPRAITHLAQRLRLCVSEIGFYEKPPADRSGGR